MLRPPAGRLLRETEISWVLTTLTTEEGALAVADAGPFRTTTEAEAAVSKTSGTTQLEQDSPEASDTSWAAETSACL